jgi:hypothetical protein
MKQVAGDSEDGDNQAMVPASLNGKRVNPLTDDFNLFDIDLSMQLCHRKCNRT